MDEIHFASRKTTIAGNKTSAKVKPRKPISPVKRPTATRMQEAIAAVPTNAAGIRMDFESGYAGFGPNFKHKFTENHGVDAALVFFKGNAVALGARYEYNSPVKGAKGSEWYIRCKAINFCLVPAKRQLA